MGVPLSQKLGIMRCIATKRFAGSRRIPLVLMLEPLFRCNLSCSGCGKIHFPQAVLNKSLTPEECFQAVDECGAPVVSIAGGEPLLHQDLPAIVSGLIAAGRFVYLCTNGLLLEKNLKEYEPSAHLIFSIHLDGDKAQHDRLANRPGLFDSVLSAIRLLGESEFKFTVNCTVYKGVRPAEIGRFFDRVLALGAKGITVSPGYGHPGSQGGDLFLRRDESKRLFREIFKEGKGRGWRFNHTSLFLDFLCGNRSYRCTPWATVTRNVLGWQRPCYLFAEGYAADFQTLMEKTDWNAYGPGRHPACMDCMLHSGFEGTAVNETIAHPGRAWAAYLRGPRTSGPFAPDPPPESEMD
jgi:hopanoid biosynthesis associated radical SAM protein HpnH